MQETKKIQESICKYLVHRGHESICENYKHIIFEMDVVSLSKSGMLHEYEVKISRSDFLADKKKHKKTGITKFERYDKPIMNRENECPNYFYYVCPDGLIDKNKIPIYAGLYYYADDLVWMVKNAKRIHNHSHDEKKILRKMLRLNIQRKYLGSCMLTYINRKIREKNAERLKRDLNPSTL